MFTGVLRAADVRERLASQGFDIVGNTPGGAWDGNRFTAERDCETQRIGDTIALFFVELQAAWTFDIKGGPRPVQTVC